MDLEELLKELQALVDKYADGTPEGVSDEQAAQDAERMSQLSADIERITAERREQRTAREAAVVQARTAIEQGSATRVDNVPLTRSASATGHVARDVTDYGKAARRAWAKDLATRGGIQLVGGNDMTAQERAAFTHMTGNTTSAVPVEVQNEIISLVDNSAVLFGDIPRSSFKHQFEFIRHKSIKAGDATVTEEGKAPVDEQNEFDTVSLVGKEITKTVKISRKMAVQSVDGFEQYLINEISARIAVAANVFAHARLDDAKLGIGTANKVNVAKAGSITKADLTKALSLLKTFSNPVPKGCIIYANSDVIWNYIAMIEDKTGKSYFVDEKSEDPTIQGSIFGRIVKQDDACADGEILLGYPDLIKGNAFDGVDVRGYVATDSTQNHCFDGYLLYDCGLSVPQGFAKLSIGTASA